MKYLDIAGSLATATDTSRIAHQHQNRGMGVQKHNTLTVHGFMEKGIVFNARYDKWFDTAANVLQDDGSKEVCRLKQTCTPKKQTKNW